MIRPDPCSIITRPAAWLAKNTPLTFTSTVRSKSASVTASAGALGPRPALLTRRSSRPSGPRSSRRRRGPGRGDGRPSAGRGPGDPSPGSQRRGRRPSRVAQPEREVGAGVGQGERDRPADAASGARDQRHLAGQLEARIAAHEDLPSAGLSITLIATIRAAGPRRIVAPDRERQASKRARMGATMTRARLEGSR